MAERVSKTLASSAITFAALLSLAGCSGASSASTPSESNSPSPTPTTSASSASPSPTSASPSESASPIPEQTANPDTPEMKLLEEVVNRSIEAAITGGIKETSSIASSGLTVTRIWSGDVETNLLDFDDQPLRGIEIYTDSVGAREFQPSSNFDTDPDFWALGGLQIDIESFLVSSVKAPFPNQFDVELSYMTPNGAVKKQQIKVLHEDGFITEITATKAQTVWIETGMVVSYVLNLGEEDLQLLSDGLATLEELGY